MRTTQRTLAQNVGYVDGYLSHAENLLTAKNNGTQLPIIQAVPDRRYEFYRWLGFNHAYEDIYFADYHGLSCVIAQVTNSHLAVNYPSVWSFLRRNTYIFVFTDRTMTRKSGTNKKSLGY